MTEISAAQACALAFAHEHGGRLSRFAAYWSFAGAPRDPRGHPDPSIPHVTIRALVKRGRLRYSRSRTVGGRPRGIEVELVAS